jgi:hypothetical protein
MQVKVQVRIAHWALGLSSHIRTVSVICGFTLLCYLGSSRYYYYIRKNKSMSRSARKRAVEEPDPIDPNDDDDDDDSDSADMEEDEEDIMEEDEQEEPQDQQLIIGSPSPAGKKDMTLRSGRRKRRRSKETSGMTPPEVKKPRTGRKSSKKEPEAALAITENGHGNAAFTEDNEMEEETNNNNNNNHVQVDEDENENEDASVQVDEDKVDEDEDASNGATKRSGRVSFGPTSTQRSGRFSLLDSDVKALVAAQDPEQSVIMEESPRDEPDSNRRLFDGTPPATPVESVSPAATAMEDTAPVVVPPVQPKNYTNGEHETMDFSEPPSGLPLRILFMVVFSLLFVTIWPLCVKLADVVIPLKELSIPDNDAALLEAPVVVTKDESSQVIPDSLFQALRNLEAVQGTADEKQTKIRDASQGLALEMEEIQTILKNKEVELESRSKVLSEAEYALSEALAHGDLTSTTWQAARQASESLGRKVLDTPSVHLWQVATPEECPDVTVAEVNPEDTHNPIVAPHVVEEQFSGLLLRARMSANKLIESPESEEKVREWARIQIYKALGGDVEASEAIAKLASPAEGGGGSEGLPDLEELFQELLEVERADRTGEYDHASILNGAKVIYGGKRGTTKSMVDSLPLYNRLMQLAQLRFYGYGPEAAITPTYPPDALGQCWSFQQTPLKDVLKRRRSSKVDKNSGDDHKRGNFGTLTISLPLPVKVQSVVLEHPPQGLTDQVSSAIRSFRIIGYTDNLATEKSWSLGSFEYSSRTFVSHRRLS